MDAEGATTYITSKNAYLELARILGEAVGTFETCYNDFDMAFYRFYLFIGHYETLGTYLINLLPNILAYALFFNQWTTRIQQLDALDEQVELLFVYAVIGRKLFLYDYLPDTLNDDLNDIDTNVNTFLALQSGKPKHL